MAEKPSSVAATDAGKTLRMDNPEAAEYHTDFLDAPFGGVKTQDENQLLSSKKQQDFVEEKKLVETEDTSEPSGKCKTFPAHPATPF